MTARVLVVDDVVANTKVLEAKLVSEYFNVITATSGAAALDIVRDQAPDIVLLDVMMPEMDGFEVCRRIKESPATTHIPVIMVTALSDTADRVRGLEAGADEFLTKPVDDMALFARVRSLVRLKQMIDEWRLRAEISEELGVLAAPTNLDTPTEKGSVLVAMPKAHDIRNASEVLARDNNEVAGAETGAEALEALKTGQFDMVMVSVALDDDDGLRLCSQIRSHEQTRQIPILLIGDEADNSLLAKGLDLGVNDYIVAPVDVNELLARVRIQRRRKRYQDRLRQNYEDSLSMALMDGLTGLYNRRYMESHASTSLRHARNDGRCLAFLVADIDHFKSVNDTYGHAAGDAVLNEIAKRFAQNIRPSDTIARFGGEEFVAALPDAGLEGAEVVAVRLRRVVADEAFDVGETKIDVTISVGAAIYDPALDPTETADEVMKRADEALYQAKRAGRNRIVLAPNPSTAKQAFAN